MRLLLDTHIWIWCSLSPERIKSSVAAAIRDPGSQLWLSPVSLWELVILVEKNRIQLDKGPVEWARQSLQRLPVREAPVTSEIALAIRDLQLPVRDPADRLLVATAKVEGLTLVTADERLKHTRDCKVLPN